VRETTGDGMGGETGATLQLRLDRDSCPCLPCSLAKLCFPHRTAPASSLPAQWRLCRIFKAAAISVNSRERDFNWERFHMCPDEGGAVPAPMARLQNEGLGIAHIDFNQLPPAIWLTVLIVNFYLVTKWGVCSPLQARQSFWPHLLWLLL